MASNSFGNYSYTTTNVGQKYYSVVSNNKESVQSPVIYRKEADNTSQNHKKWALNLLNFYYYVDNGADAYSRLVGSALISALVNAETDPKKKSASSILLSVLSTLNDDCTTSEKVTEILKLYPGVILPIDPFFVGDIVIYFTNKNNCKDVFNKLRDLPYYEGPGDIIG